MVAVVHLLACLGCALLFAVALPTRPVQAENIPCYEVLSELNRRISRGMDRDPKKIAKRLDTEQTWVEECLRLHGRRVSSPRFVPDVETDDSPTLFDPNDLEDPFLPPD